MTSVIVTSGKSVMAVATESAEERAERLQKRLEREDRIRRLMDGDSDLQPTPAQAAMLRGER